MIKNTKDKVIGALKRVKDNWMTNHAKKQEEFSTMKSRGYGDVGWNPFKKK